MIRVLVVDDHTLVREGLCHLLEIEDDIQVVGQACTGREAIEICSCVNSDVVILDYCLPDMDGLTSIRLLLTLGLDARILVLTMHANQEYAARCIQAGASGFVVKAESPDDLLAAVRKVAAGGVYISPSISDKMIVRMQMSADADPLSSLADRDMQVLLFLSSGLTTREVASKLNLSISTIETYRGRVLTKLNLRNNSDITRFAVRHGLITLDTE